jgi:hypothetical protein
VGSFDEKTKGQGSHANVSLICRFFQESEERRKRLEELVKDKDRQLEKLNIYSR